MDLSKKIRNGGVQMLNAKMLGKNMQGKGDFYRISNADPKYIENYNKIFDDKSCPNSEKHQKHA